MTSSSPAIDTMPSSDYTASSGALKLKGAAGIVKKKRKKSKPSESTAESSSSVSKKEDNLEDTATTLGAKRSSEDEDDVQEELRKHKIAGGAKTEAEIRFEEKRRKRLEEQLRKDGTKTHKERVEDLNRYLSKLSEHHDMYVKIHGRFMSLLLIFLGHELDLVKTTWIDHQLHNQLLERFPW